MKRIFKIGDKIKCVDKGCRALIYDKTYDVLNTGTGDLVNVLDEDGDVAEYHSWRFKLDRVGMRNDILDEILI